MSSGTFYTVPLPENPMRLLKKPDVYDIRTTDQHIAALESDVTQLRADVNDLKHELDAKTEAKAASDAKIAMLEQRIADIGMLYTQLQEIVRGEPVFVPPTDNWSMNK